jgi:hypothetical protein
VATTKGEMVQQSTAAEPDSGATARPEGFRATVLAPDEVPQRLAEGPMWVAERVGSIVGTVSAVRRADALYVRSMKELSG